MAIKRFDLGIPDYPWPSMEVEYKDGKYSTVMHVVEDAAKPLPIYSKWFDYYQQMGVGNAYEKAYERIMGIAYRDMPVPSMLQYFKESSNARTPDSRDLLELVIGAPGMGKSYGAQYHSRLRDPEPALFFDCAGRDSGDLLFELVLDHSANADIYMRIEKRIGEHNSGKLLPPPLLAILQRAELRQVFSMDGARIGVDWNRFGLLPKGEDSSDRSAIMETARTSLHLFATEAGIQMNGLSDISFKEQKGKLILAAESGCNCILDEVNLAKNLDKIKVVLQVINGEIDSCVIADKSGGSYMLSRNKIELGFTLTANGNHTTDGNSTQILPESIYSRFKNKYFIPRPTVEDFQHRICQKLTGLPISTLHHMQQNARQTQNKSFSKEEFTEFLHYMRALGTEGHETVPAYQSAMIDHYEDVIEASSRLAKLYYSWAETLDRDELQRKMQSNSGSAQELNALLMETDEKYAKEIGVGMRMMMGHLSSALNVTPETIALVKSGGFNLRARKLPINPDSLSPEEPELRFGTRLSRIIINAVDNTSRQYPKPAINKKLTELLTTATIFPPDLKEGKRSNVKLLAELLDIDVLKGQSASQQTAMVQRLLCDLLRSREPELSGNNEDLIPLSKLGQMLTQDRSKAVIDSHTAVLAIPNLDLDHVSDHPIHNVIIHDAGYQPATNSILVVPAEKLADHDELMMALAIPKMRESNLPVLWNKSLINSGGQGACYSNNEEDNEPLRMAMRDKPQCGISITSVTCRKSGTEAAETMIILIHDDKAPHTIIVGDSIHPSLLRMMARTNVTYIDRASPTATDSARRAIDTMMTGKPVQVTEDLKAAFLMRHTVLEDYPDKKPTFSQMITQPITHCEIKNYATNISQLGAMNHLQRALKPVVAMGRTA